MLPGFDKDTLARIVVLNRRLLKQITNGSISITKQPPISINELKSKEKVLCVALEEGEQSGFAFNFDPEAFLQEIKREADLIG